MFLSQLKAIRRLLAVRLTFSLLIVFVVVTVLAWLGTFALVQREMDRLVDARLSAQLDVVVDALEAGQDLPQPGFGQEVAVLLAHRTLGGLSFPIPSQSDGTYDFDSSDHDQPEFRYLIKNRSDGRIVIAEMTERQEELRQILGGGVSVSLLGTLLAGLLAGSWLAWRSQIRLNIISEGLALVADGHLDTRISLPGKVDDLSLLADRVNTTTARLEHAVTQMRVQSSNIAHDLRTPLARLRAQIESDLFALSERGRPVSIDDMGSALEQIDHITGTFNALLRLALIESGAGKVAFAIVDLGVLAEQVAETFDAVAEDADQHLVLGVIDAAQVTGDRDLIVQLTVNLIQNALRYGPDGQTITLRIDGNVLSVIDQGPGIPAELREQVFQPLFQMEGTRQSEGVGLGLSMVRVICELHGANLSLKEGPNGCGLKVSVTF